MGGSFDLQEVGRFVAGGRMSARGRGDGRSRSAVIDVGSNTIHLLVGEVESGTVMPVTGEKVSARLGAGVDRTGRIEDERIPLAAQAISLFARLADLNGVPGEALSVLATSAVRDAENGPELCEKVAREAGLYVRLISGEEEASLGFRGAVSALGTDFSWRTPALVVDLGGGSAQLILGHARGGPEKQISLPLGSNRTTERHARHDPPSEDELEALRAAVTKVLPDWELPEGAPVVAIGGSARAVLRLTRGPLTRQRLRELAAEVASRPSAVLAREEGVSPERARVMPAAITTLSAILERFGGDELVVARGGLREGAILTMVEGMNPDGEER